MAGGIVAEAPRARDAAVLGLTDLFGMGQGLTRAN